MLPRTRRAPPRNYMSQREQRKMLALVLILGLVLIAMFEVSKPQRWLWIWQLAGEHPMPQGPLDTRLKPEPAPSVPGGGVLLAEHRQAELPRVEPAQLHPGVNDELLRQIKDDAPFQTNDYDPYFHLLELARTTDESELRRIARRDVVYHQLFNQPAAYRGQVIHLRGRLRGLFNDLRARENGFNIVRYHQLWISPEDRPSEVFVVHALNLPADLNVERATEGIVELSGFFFKRWVYQARDGELHTTPLLLANQFQWRLPPTEAAQPEQELLNEWVAAVFIAVVLAGAIVWCFVLRGADGGTTRRNPLARKAPPPPPVAGIPLSEMNPEALAALEHQSTRGSDAKPSASPPE